jgi:hypothetical protein
MKVLSVLLVFIIACGGIELPETSQGCKIDRRNISGLPSDYEHSKALDILIKHCKLVFSETKVRDVLKTITIEWWDDTAPSPSSGELNTVVIYNGYVYSGVTIGNMCKVAWRGKLFRSAFIHEILHVVGNYILYKTNANHDILILYDLENAINKELIEKNI